MHLQVGWGLADGAAWNGGDEHRLGGCGKRAHGNLTSALSSILPQAAELRREHRMDRGATEINMPECAITVDDPTAEAPKVSP